MRGDRPNRGTRSWPTSRTTIALRLLAGAGLLLAALGLCTCTGVVLLRFTALLY